MPPRLYPGSKMFRENPMSFVLKLKGRAATTLCVLALIVGAALPAAAASGASLAGQEIGGRGADGSRDRYLRWLQKYYPELYRPDFAKLDLARVPPGPYEEAVPPGAPFKAGGKIILRLLTINTSDKRVYFPVAGHYTLHRLRLVREGELVPYKGDVAELIQEQDEYRGRSSGRFEHVDPRAQMTEHVDLNDWYEPLRPGRYELVVRRRFISGGGWVESPSVAFEVVP